MIMIMCAVTRKAIEAVLSFRNTEATKNKV